MKCIGIDGAHHYICFSVLVLLFFFSFLPFSLNEMSLWCNSEFLLLLTYFCIMLPKYTTKHSNAIFSWKCRMPVSAQYMETTQITSYACRCNVKKVARTKRFVCIFNEILLPLSFVKYIFTDRNTMLLFYVCFVVVFHLVVKFEYLCC